MNERLAYEKAVHKQRLRTEISQVKREANFYIQNSEKNRTIKSIEEKKRKRGKLTDDDSQESEKRNYVTQRETEEEILTKKNHGVESEDSKPQIKSGKVKKKQKSVDKASKKSLAARTSFLKSIFSGGVDDPEGS